MRPAAVVGVVVLGVAGFGLRLAAGVDPTPGVLAALDLHRLYRVGSTGVAVEVEADRLDRPRVPAAANDYIVSRIWSALGVLVCPLRPQPAPGGVVVVGAGRGDRDVVPVRPAVRVGVARSQLGALGIEVGDFCRRIAVPVREGVGLDVRCTEKIKGDPVRLDQLNRQPRRVEGPADHVPVRVVLRGLAVAGFLATQMRPAAVVHVVVLEAAGFGLRLVVEINPAHGVLAALDLHRLRRVCRLRVAVEVEADRLDRPRVGAAVAVAVVPLRSPPVPVGVVVAGAGRGEAAIRPVVGVARSDLLARGGVVVGRFA